MKRKYTNLSNLTPEEIREHRIRVQREGRQRRAKDPKHRAKITAYAKEYRHKNPSSEEYKAKAIQRTKEWALNNSELSKKNKAQHYLDTKASPPHFAARTFNSQRTRSRLKGREMPTYTKEWLQEWLLAQPNFQTLLDEWVASDYSKWLAPSVDRIDNSIGYTEDNIQLMTWKENHLKGET